MFLLFVVRSPRPHDRKLVDETTTPAAVAARFSANRASTSAAGINLPALAESSPA
jgi:hypothetical protein